MYKEINKIEMKGFVSSMLVAITCGLLIWACANRGYPEGGPKDEVPPHVILEAPESYNTNFDKKNIRIYFDEFVQLKSINEKFVISPPQTKNPKVSLRGKYIVVEFQDSLRKDVTYSLDFADAIVDNNESNPLGFYRYVFSTGSAIDTLEVAGQVVDAEMNQPIIGAAVYLYENLEDSIPLKNIPDYMARTDSSGMFHITNLREANYRVVALIDEDRNKIYMPEAEKFAFLDTMIHPVVFPVMRTDTIYRDSIVGDTIITHEVLVFGPGDLQLRMFKETSTQLYMTDELRPERELLKFTFSIPEENEFAISLFDTTGVLPKSGWYEIEKNKTKDTINVWITDTTVYKRDTLKFALSYLRTDSLRQYSTFNDTIKLLYKDKKVKEPKKKKKDEEEETPKIELMKINFRTGQSQDLHRPFTFEFPRPIHAEGLKNLKVEQKIDTTEYASIPFKLERDSLHGRTYHVNVKWKPEGEYRVTLDSASVYDIYGLHNGNEVKNFKVKTVEDYGKIVLSMKNVSGTVLVQMYKGGGGKGSNTQSPQIITQKVVTGDGDVEFSYLSPDTYRFRAVYDNNKNGKWDPGVYLKKIQPEKVVYLDCDLEVRQNFDVSQEFDLLNPYKEVAKPDKKDKKKGKTK